MSWARVIYGPLVVLVLAGLCTSEAEEEKTAIKEIQPGEPEALLLDGDARFLAAVRASNQAYQYRLAAIKANLDSDDTAARLEALDMLGRLRDHTTIKWVVPLLDADLHPPEILRAACTCVARMDAISAEVAVRKLLRSEDEDVRLAALNTLTKLEKTNQTDYRREAVSRNDELRGMGNTQIGVLQDTEASAILVAALNNDSRDHVRRMACLSIARLGNAGLGKPLTDALTDRDPLVRRYAAEGLVKLDYKPAIPYLIFALEANIAGVHINKALMELSGQDFGYAPDANVLELTRTVERGFEWWSLNAERFR